MVRINPQKTDVRIYESFEQAKEDEISRLSRMTPSDRMAAFASLQERAFGEAWTRTPIKKEVSWEIVEW